MDPKIAKKLKVEFWQAKVHVVKTAHGRGRGGEDESEWTICALKGDKKTVAAAAPEFKAACESLAGKQGGGKLPSVIACGFAEFITKIASTVKPPSIPITNRAKPGEPPLHIQKKKRKAGESGDADDMPLNKLQKKVLPYAGKKRGPKTKAEKAAEAAAKSDDAPISAMMVAKSPKKRGPKPKGLVPQSSAAKGKSKGGKKVMGSLGDE
mgnify:CR=1 FL=1